MPKCPAKPTHPLARKAKAVLLASLLASQSFMAQADQVCAGKASNLYIQGSGDVAVRFSYNDYMNVCNLNATWNGVSVTTCAAWVNTLRNAVSRNADLLVYYTGSTACNALPTYGNAPAPYYIMLMN